jgi:hypothetical protein
MHLLFVWITGARRRPFLAAALVQTLAAGACAARPNVPSPPDPLSFPFDSALFAVLATDPGPAQLAAFERFEALRGAFMTDTLAVIAEDTAIHSLLRANAIRLIGQRLDLANFIVVPPAFDDPDVRVRLAAVAAAREFLVPRPDAATRLLGLALRDSSTAVQALALEALAGRDAAVLMEYLGRSPPPQLATVARDLLTVAGQRGDPLEPVDSTGRLERTGPGGHTLVYRPDQRWEQWELSAGSLELVPAGAAPVRIGFVEVAAAVIPAFFSPDGRYLVFESDRTIRVHDVPGATTREVGPGIAPRPIPFTDDFVYMREEEGGRAEMQTGARILYDVVRAPFAASAGGVTMEPAVLMTVGANANFEVRGGASPLRWARVVETSPGMFSIIAGNADPIPLPDPFGAFSPPGR